MHGGEFLTIEEAAKTLGVSTRHARRLADSGALGRVARGLIDRSTVDRYLQSQRQGRTRTWAEHTAWAAVAMLAGQDADWLGATQSSRLRRTLRELTEVQDLLTRMRDRARLHTFDAHRAAIPRLRSIVATSSTRSLGIAHTIGDGIDGYIDAGEVDAVVRTLGLRASMNGAVTLRVTEFDVDRVRELVGSPVVAALDAATSTDPRMRGAGRRVLADVLDAYR
ncbi:helix-turn-helix domain-containing protein [Luteipulveratus sp. YIM 133132]|uniref:Helix-turn-helix domain-containing protein n=1 Tax=Luteipulveratus flavus TaxID=3031728 RepID=A0ABT6C872_9MICO|nr:MULTISPECIES: helix-turn-helix domain-containing protein [unclassified Luteipulveratus]MDE9366462.1 helix-turn-helix domain-containing protein [Luteipulveratus sp. YIM 133132]MDF8264264.1 helix-turn-helix domain-containing protein [Luteipulveratus sp. YIM 133296]